MSNRLTLRCPGCNAKLRAPVALLGKDCPCPQCKRRLVVRLPIPSDAEVNLVPISASMRTVADRWGAAR
jgi:hypothetical protein